MHENHASIVALHRLKTFFKKSADTFASTQYFNKVENQIKLLGGRQGRSTIVMGDFNSSAGEGEESSIVGCFGLGRETTKASYSWNTANRKSLPYEEHTVHNQRNAGTLGYDQMAK